MYTVNFYLPPVILQVMLLTQILFGGTLLVYVTDELRLLTPTVPLSIRSSLYVLGCWAVACCMGPFFKDIPMLLDPYGLLCLIVFNYFFWSSNNVRSVVYQRAVF